MALQITGIANVFEQNFIVTYKLNTRITAPLWREAIGHM